MAWLEHADLLTDFSLIHECVQILQNNLTTSLVMMVPRFIYLLEHLPNWQYFAMLRKMICSERSQSIFQKPTVVDFCLVFSNKLFPAIDSNWNILFIGEYYNDLIINHRTYLLCLTTTILQYAREITYCNFENTDPTPVIDESETISPWRVGRGDY